MKVLVNFNGIIYLIQERDINMESELVKHMLFNTNNGNSGFIRNLDTLQEITSVYIGSFNLRRLQECGDTSTIFEIDSNVIKDALKQIKLFPLAIKVPPF